MISCRPVICRTRPPRLRTTCSHENATGITETERRAEYNFHVVHPDRRIRDDEIITRSGVSRASHRTETDVAEKRRRGRKKQKFHTGRVAAVVVVTRAHTLPPHTSTWSSPSTVTFVFFFFRTFDENTWRPFAVSFNGRVSVTRE